VFQENPATGDRRISGSMASLAGLEAGDPMAVPRILLAHALVLGFGGLPVLWTGDELGALNDPDWETSAPTPEHPGERPDNRWMHRPCMRWPVPPDQHGITAGLRRLVRARGGLPHLHAAVAAEVLDPRDPAVLLVARRHPLGTMLGAYNVAPEPRHVPLSLLHDCGLDPGSVVDRLRGDHPAGEAPEIRDEAVQLPAYGAAWLTAPATGPRRPA
jgi:amylosucrase